MILNWPELYNISYIIHINDMPNYNVRRELIMQNLITNDAAMGHQNVALGLAGHALPPLRPL